MLINMEAHDSTFMVIKKKNGLTFDALARNLQSGLLKNKEHTKFNPCYFLNHSRQYFRLNPASIPSGNSTWSW